MSLIIARMRGSASNAKNHLLRNGGSSTGGPRGHMECRGYGPCVVEGVDEHQRAVDMRFDEVKCAAVSAEEVLRRACENVAIDERLYLAARREFEARGDSGSGDSSSGGSGGGSSGSSGSSGDSGGTAAPGDLWLVFMDEGMSLQQLIFAAPDGGQVVPSDFWHGLRTSPAVSSVFHTLILQVSRRQLGVALSLSSVVAR
jgi:hypothetical protein